MTDQGTAPPKPEPRDEGKAVARAAKSLMRAGKYLGAMRLLQAHIARWPMDQDADYLLGVAALRSDNEDVALAAFTRCVRADPANALAQHGLGVSLRRQGRYAEAREALQAALRADPEMVRAAAELNKLPVAQLDAHALSRVSSANHTRAPSSGVGIPELRLRVASGPAVRREFRIVRSPVIIGRGHDVDVQLLDDEDISRRHVVVRHEAGRWELEDAGSLNGTGVNGKRLHGRHSLCEGDEIVVGGSTLVVELPEGSAAVDGQQSRVRAARSRVTPPAAADEAPPYEPILGERVVVGRVQHIALRQELDQNRALTAYRPNIQKQSISVLSFRLIRTGQPPVAVEMRGRMIGGTIPRDGDRVAVPEHWRDNSLRVRRLQSLETGEIVAALEPSAAAKGLFRVGIVAFVIWTLVVLAFIAFVASQVIPELIDRA